MRFLSELNVGSRNVLLRLALDIPFDQHNQPTDLYRVERCLPTIDYLLSKKAKIIILSKRGHEHDLSLQPLAGILTKLLRQNIVFFPECIGLRVKKAIAKLQPGQILLLENVRMHNEEKANDLEFAKELAALGDVFINDAFADAHRKQASVATLPKLLPSAAGKLMRQEVQVLSKVLTNPWRPLTAIIGGVKIQGKADVIKQFLDHADNVL